MKREIYVESVICTIALLLFLNGFFPITNYTPPTNVQMYHCLSEPKYHRTVWMVLDGLRVDYLETESNVPNITKLLQDPRFEGCAVKAVAKIPTTTLPGIKALTTGAPSKFIDLLYNFGEENKVADSIIHRLYNIQKQILFYGDEPWSRLFSPFFLRSEGYYGFQIYDFDSIDNAITNHLRIELPRDDWDIMIMHYLGLDHVGHVETPNGPSVKRKLKEYDGLVVEILDSLKIWEKETGQKSLFIITGDHGMLDVGNHGGMEFDEAVVPLIFFGLPCEKNNISMLQIDIVPLLSVLLGAPIPSTSIGKIIPELYSKVTNKEKIPIFREYFNHLSSLSSLPQHVLKDIQAIDEEIKNFEFSSKEHNATTRIIDLYEKGIALMSDNLTNLNEMDLYSAILAMMLLISSLIVIGLSLLDFFSNKISLIKQPPISYTVIFMILLLLFHNGLCLLIGNSCTLCLGNNKNNFIIILTQGLYLSSLGYNVIKIRDCSSYSKFKTLNWLKYVSANKTQIVFLILFMFRGFLFLGQSFMVHDRLILFYFCTTGITYIIYDLTFSSKRYLFSKSILIYGGFGLIFIRLAKENFNEFWVNDGVKNVQWLYFMLILLVLFAFNKYYFHMNKNTTILYGITLITIYFYRVAINDFKLEILSSLSANCDNVILARICIFFIFITSGKFIYDKRNIKTSYKKLDNFIFVWLLLNTLLLRPFNIPSLFVIFYLSQILLKSWTKSFVIKAILYVWIGNVFFYSQGNTDQLTSVDFLVGFTGQRNLNISTFAVFTLIPLYSAPVFSYLLLRKEIDAEHNLSSFKRKKNDELSKSTFANYFLFFHYLFLIIQLGILMTIMNTHWFIWSLFAPKFLYFTFNFLIFLLCMIVV